ncbi:MAG TPA: DEAD/DEAH box helicase [Synergistales bacterium]|jgi:ATP-dependent RNA helicase DeaD|nr:DEAD/DEAH box helicase [Synergistaceae bacterium]MDD3915563.1 DEAD/DEAH box helicase [Synergistaceae bacterium]HPE64650.1 DEAD/DEAH box helicase [Synergistales bacterium]HRV98614.1 DEAD/DEAH box helicase [Aminobacteriaceae bacterium]
MSENGFACYSLREELLLALNKKGFSIPTPVQEKVLSMDRFDTDLIVRAKTGSGKTLAFLLPLLQEMELPASAPLILVLSPTRELAQQTAREAEWLSRYLDISVATLVGGLDMTTQIRSLKEGAVVVVGTPGRTLDHVNRGSLKTEKIHTVILDEGDHMLDMGFRDELEGILDALPHRNRTWLFSATMPREVKELSRKYLSSPVSISLVEDGDQHEDIVHKAYLVPFRHKMEGLVNVLLWERPKRGLIFCHTRLETMNVSQRLNEEGFNSGSLHGEMTQRERNAVLSAFKNGHLPLLVATNVAARGLDVEGVTHVIQIGLPDDRDTFVHRSGRTGRAGHEGMDILLLSPQEAEKFKYMIGSAKVNIEWNNVPDVQAIGKVQREIAEEKLLTLKEASENEDYLQWAEDLLTRVNPKNLVARLLFSLTSKRSAGYNLAADLERELRRKSRGPVEKDRTPGNRSLKGGRPKGTMLRLSKGLADGWDVGRVLHSVCTSLNVDRSEVGAIRMKDDHVLVELLPVALSRFEEDSRGLERCGLIEEGKGRDMLFQAYSTSRPSRDRAPSPRPRRQSKTDSRNR